MRSPILAVLVGGCLAGPASGQHVHERSPYAGQEASEIPSLSAQELEDLRTAAGMGMARAAELNHYPGPKHALEMADELALTREQRARIEAIQQAMRTDALRIGEEIIRAEGHLNQRFALAHADSVRIREAAREIGFLYGELRYVHLAAHLATRSVLDARQVAEYDRLRGYEPSR